MNSAAARVTRLQWLNIIAIAAVLDARKAVCMMKTSGAKLFWMALHRLVNVGSKATRGRVTARPASSASRGSERFSFEITVLRLVGAASAYARLGSSALGLQEIR